MNRFCVAAIVAAEDRDTANAALQSAGLPSGLSVALVAGHGVFDPAPDLPITHYAQHSWEDQPTIDAMRAIPGIGLLVWQGEESEGPIATLEAAWLWAQALDPE